MCGTNTSIWHHTPPAGSIFHSISHHLPARSLRIPQPPKNPFQNYLTSITSTHATDHQHCRWTRKSHSCVCPLQCGSQTPPTTPCDGPYPVAVQTNKHFTVTVNGRNTTISIDHLKPAHLDLESNMEHSLATTESLPNEQSHHIPVSSHLTPHSHSPPPPPHTSIYTPTTPRSTRSGRRVHFPQYFSHHV